VAQLAHALDQAGLPAEIVPDVDVVLWSKLAVAVVGPVSALVPATIGTLGRNPNTRRVMLEASREIVEVARGSGIDLDAAAVEAQLRRILETSAPNRPSMLDDVLAGRPTEIEARCGAVVEAGRAVGVPTPVNELLLLMVRGLQESYSERLTE
jgi:2-dehydropantoate 2-reductase